MTNQTPPIVDRAIGKLERVAGDVIAAVHPAHDSLNDKAVDLREKAELHEQRAEANLAARELHGDAEIAEADAVLGAQVLQARVDEQRHADELADAVATRQVRDAINTATQDVEAQREEAENVAETVAQTVVADTHAEDTEAKRERAQEHREAAALSAEADRLRAEAEAINPNGATQ